MSAGLAISLKGPSYARLSVEKISFKQQLPIFFIDIN
jgi:hypothetical protein